MLNKADQAKLQVKRKLWATTGIWYENLHETIRPSYTDPENIYNPDNTVTDEDRRIAAEIKARVMMIRWAMSRRV